MREDFECSTTAWTSERLDAVLQADILRTKFNFASMLLNIAQRGAPEIAGGQRSRSSPLLAQQAGAAIKISLPG